MNTLHIILAITTGFLLGLFYFGGLWLTVTHLTRSPYGPLLITLSLIIRLSITAAGFYLVMHGSMENLLACLAGLLMARVTLVRRLGPQQLILHPHE